MGTVIWAPILCYETALLEAPSDSAVRMGGGQMQLGFGGLGPDGGFRSIRVAGAATASWR